MIVVKLKQGQIITPVIKSNKQWLLIESSTRNSRVSRIIHKPDCKKVYWNNYCLENIKESIAKNNNPDNKFIWLITEKNASQKNQYPIKIEKFGYLFIDEESTPNYKLFLDELYHKIKEYNYKVYNLTLSKNIWDWAVMKAKDKKIISDSSQIAIMFSNGDINYTGLSLKIESKQSTVDNSNKITKESTAQYYIDLYDNGKFIFKQDIKSLPLDQLSLLIKERPRILIAAMREINIIADLKNKGDMWFNSKIKKHDLLKKRTKQDTLPVTTSNFSNEEKTCYECNVSTNRKFLSTIMVDNTAEELCNDCEKHYYGYWG